MAKLTVPSPRRRSPIGGVWRAIVAYSPDRGLRGEARVLGPQPLLIGREGDGEHGLRLDDGEVSRTHCTIEVGPGCTARVQDLKSRNGTLVDGRRVDDAQLAHGAVIRAGAHVIVVEHLEHEACEALLRPARPSKVLIGNSAAMVAVRQRLAQVAVAPAPVLLLGESGVGKELAAREVHRLSGRAGLFVAINCTAIPAHLAESELFGHARGAFTGAERQTDGVFGAAEGGTLLLDEIGDMPMALQPKLLRALATGEIRRVGETRARPVDVRVVAASNKDIGGAVTDGSFRGDLHARLLGGLVRLPPLRERRDDIIVLAEHFLDTDRPVRLSPDAAEALLLHRWPYNVRELEHIIGALLPLTRSRMQMDLAHLPEAIRRPVEQRAASSPTDHPSPHAHLLRIRRDRIPTAEELDLLLKHFGGSVAQVADFFGRDRRQVYRWAERLGLEVGRGRRE